MYLPGELTSALARVQLPRLAETTAGAQRNGARLTERLRGLRAVETPIVPADRTHVFHKYRVRLDPRRAGSSLAPNLVRDRLLEGLRAEGVEAVLWQERALPHHPLFSRPDPDPNASAGLDGAIVIGSQTEPTFREAPPIVEARAG